LEVQKILKSGCTSHQADRHGYLLKAKIEIPEQMPDQINSSSAQSAVTEKLGLNQRLADDLI
jgi:hypothetical protein